MYVQYVTYMIIVSSPDPTPLRAGVGSGDETNIIIAIYTHMSKIGKHESFKYFAG